MVQARISNYLKNSDFTTQKQKGAYTIDLTVPAGTYQYGRTFTNDISVPNGVYFENVTLSSSLDVGVYYPANNVVLAGSTQDWYYYFGVFQASPGVYRLQVTLMVLDPSGQTPVPSFSVHAKIHLSVSPFE